MYSSFKYQNPLNLAHSLNSGQAFRWRIEKESSQKWFNGIVDNELIKIRRISDEIQLIHNDNFSPIESIFSQFVEVLSSHEVSHTPQRK